MSVDKDANELWPSYPDGKNVNNTTTLENSLAGS